jgi:hypothetical protein
LTEDSKETKCYDWLLIDPTDKPFATFKFHYRSWDNLSSLQLIPINHPRNLLFPSPSLLSLNGQSANALRKKDALKREEGDKCSDSIGTFSTEAPHTPPKSPLRGDTYDGESDFSREGDRRDALGVPRSPSPYYHNLSPASLEALGYFAPPMPQLPSTSQLERTEILNRPLPEIPRERRASQSSRRVSESSDALSMTPSLRSHYGDYAPGSFSPSPIAETATAAQFRKSKHPPKLIEVKRQSTREQDYPAPLAIPLKKQSSRIFSGISMRKHRNSSPNNNRATTKTTLSDHDKKHKHKREEYESHDDEITPISVTESEWLSNVPFTSRAQAKQKLVGRNRGLSRDEYSDDAEEAALLRHQPSYYSMMGTESGVDTDSLMSNGEIKPPAGWI